MTIRFTAAGLCVAIACLATPSRSAAAPAGTATARYNPSTGTMVLDVGSGLGVLGIVSEGNVILGNTYSPTPQMLDMDVIAYFNPNGFPFQTVRLENAFVTGLTPSDFIFTYVPVGEQVVEGEVTIPEPTSAAILAVAVVGVSRAARRRTRRLLG